MAIRKALKSVWLFLTDEDTEYLNRSVEPPKSRGFAGDYKALSGDARKVSGDMHRALNQTKKHLDAQ